MLVKNNDESNHASGSYASSEFLIFELGVKSSEIIYKFKNKFENAEQIKLREFWLYRFISIY